MISSLANPLADNLGARIKDNYYDALLVIPENSFSNLFADKFEIKDAKDVEKFHQAFRICTEGQGNELKSINNVISSALLPLLTFFRLLGDKSGFSFNIELDNKLIKFNRCFFEVRNTVVTPNRPSCVDVALYSSESKAMLFLESKLSEYHSVTKELEIKKGYAELYNDKEFQTILSAGGLMIEGDKLKLSSGGNAYLEGIKQSISHLIGMVQGPSQNWTGVYYPEQYREDYENCFFDAKTIYYATIIFDPKEIGANELYSAYDNYRSLYTNTIGANGNEITECIRRWPKLKTDTQKKIVVLSEPLSYHKAFKDNCSLLLPAVRRFYRL